MARDFEIGFVPGDFTAVEARKTPQSARLPIPEFREARIIRATLFS